MSPRPQPPRTEKNERDLQSALAKVEKAGKDPERTIGGALRQAAKEGA